MTAVEPTIPLCFLQVAQSQEVGRLPAFLQRLTDPEASADFPPAHRINVRTLDNRELDKLVAALGRNKSTWRRQGAPFLQPASY